MTRKELEVLIELCQNWREELHATIYPHELVISLELIEDYAKQNLADIEASI